jgi:hypothetical protein
MAANARLLEQRCSLGLGKCCPKFEESEECHVLDQQFNMQFSPSEPDNLAYAAN